MYRLLIVDDEPMIVEGLKAYIHSRRIILSVPWILPLTAERPLEQMEKQPPDMLITDIRMPQLDGIGLLSAVREREWGTKVIVLSGYNDFEYVRSMAVLGLKIICSSPLTRKSCMLRFPPR